METVKIEGAGLGNTNNISQYSISRDMSNPNASSSKGKITTLKGFLLSHRAKEGDEVTHTRIGDSKSNIYGGKYNIPDNHLQDFFEIYKKDVIDKKQKEYLTERQKEKGPIAIDLDFHYDYEIDERQHGPTHIFDMVEDICNKLKRIFCFVGSEPFGVYIFEKPDVNQVKDKKITKDGIHILIDLSVDKIVSNYLRNQMLNSFPSILGTLPINNDDGWEGVIDNSVMSRSTGWQLYGSRKPNHKAYSISYIYRFKYDEDDEEFSIEKVDTTEFSKNIDLMKLSVRNTKCQELQYLSSFIPEYEQLKKTNERSCTSSISQSLHNNTIQSLSSISSFSFNTYELSRISSKEQLDDLYSKYLQYVNSHSYFSELRDIIPLTMSLPKSYYGTSSYEKWIKVRFALKNSCPDDNRNLLLPLWLKFSSQSESFDYNSISSMVYDWDKKGRDGNGKLITYKSIRWWVKEDNKVAYDEIITNSTKTQLNKVIEDASADKKGCGEAEITKLLHLLKGSNFVCASFAHTIWYQIINGRYVENDGGVTLINYIMQGFRTLINSEMSERQSRSVDNTNEKKKSELETIRAIYNKLGREQEARRIMQTAKHLFYEPELLNKLDSNPELLCFNNGVFDFSDGRFREARPDDYLSKCTNIDYIELDETHIPIIAEIETFFRSIIPEEELYEYMLDFLASTLNGTSGGKNQKFNMWIGGGANGKSALISLLTKVLGDYATTISTTIITEKRTQIGGHCGELLDVKGSRFVVINEPQKKEKINEGIMKQLTSNSDKITARAMYKIHETFVPQCSWVLAANILMEVDSMDHGTWRRIDVVPFKSLFTANPVKGDPINPYQYYADPDVPKKFDSWKEVFASMLIKRVMKTNGIVIPCSIVRQASDSYKHSQDLFSQFVAERITEEKGSTITTTQLKNEYAIWYQTNGNASKVPSGSELFSKMDKIYPRKNSRKWVNIKFIDNNEDDNPDDDY